MIEKTLTIPESILKAENMSYDNSNSGLNATDTQAAIDEIQNQTLTALYFDETLEINVPVATPLTTQHIVDNVESDATNKVLSAKQGKVLNTRISNIIAHNNDTDGNTELTDLRVDADGVEHDSAGDAVRSQVSKLSSEIVEQTMYSNFADVTKDYELLSGFYAKTSGNFLEHEFGECTEIFEAKEGDKFLLTLSYGSLVGGICEYSESGTFIQSILKTDGSDNIKVVDYEYIVPSGVSKIAFSSFPKSVQPLIIKKIDTVKKRIESLEKGSSNPLNGKTISVTGDSITRGAGNYNIGWAEIIASNNNMTVNNYAVSGGTLATDTVDESGNNRHWISNTIESMEEADYMIISGGFNDYGNGVAIGTMTANMSGDYEQTADTSTIMGAIEQICRDLLANFPTKKMGFVFTHKANATYRKDNSVGNTMTEVHDAIKSVLNRYSIPYCDLFECSQFNTEIQSFLRYTSNNDGVHPTQEGYELFYVSKIEAWLKTL